MIDKAEKEIQAVLKKHNLKVNYEFEFPKYRELPDEVLLALRILKNHGLKILLTLIPKPKQSK